jgi:hypothetical protein
LDRLAYVPTGLRSRHFVGGEDLTVAALADGTFRRLLDGASA